MGASKRSVTARCINTAWNVDQIKEVDGSFHDIMPGPKPRIYMQTVDLRDRHRDSKNAQLSLNRRRNREAAGQGQMGSQP